MPKVQNTFSIGTLNKDSELRFVPNGQMIDAENFIVNTTEGSSVGVGRNVPGNLKKSNLNFAGAKTIGKATDPANNKVYNFIKSDAFDYIVEYDTVEETSTIVLQSTTGTRLNFKEGERILSADIVSDTEGDGNLIAFSGDSNPPRIFNIERAKTWGTDNFTEGDISVMKPSPIFSPSIVMTTSVDGIDNNFLDNKFVVLGYRYKYEDNFYSAPSSWTKVAFEPSLFSLDYQSSENNGMINLSNAVNITFNTGPRNVKEVDLLFRESNSSIIYVIQNFVKSEEGWNDNSNQTFQLSKSKIYTVLSEEQYFRNYDNVPLSAVSQAIIGNRIAYANYIEGRDLGVKIDFDVDFESREAISEVSDAEIENFTDNLLTYKNVVDFERGNSAGGSSPQDQMDFETNTLNVELIDGSTEARITIEVTPSAGYSTVPYSIIVKSGSTTVASYLGINGNQTRTYTKTDNGPITVYLVSDNGLIYNCKVNSLLRRTEPFVSNISSWDYFADHQLSYPKQGGYGPEFLGDTVIDRVAVLDVSELEYSKGKQIRINFEMQSSLVRETKPSVTFFYNITEDYVDTSDFIANSSFVSQLEDVFSETFKLNEISNEGSLVEYQKFNVEVVGETISITTPKVIYSVTEPSTVVENKDEFFLVSESQLFTTSGNAFASMHSNRDYEVGLIYMDGEGRKNTILVDSDNSVYIPAENSKNINTLKVTINNDPPAWAKYYKFAIKQTKRNYETVYGNIVYSDGIYRWIKLVGENKNKVVEGTILIVKADYGGPLETLIKTRVLEIVDQPENFISGNVLQNGSELKEESGLYMKIKQGSFDANITDESFQEFSGYGKRRYATRSFVTTAPYFGEYVENTFEPIEVNAGSVITFYVNVKAYGSIAFDHTCEIIVTAQENYPTVQDWWEAEIQELNQWINFSNDYLLDWQWGTDGRDFQVKPFRDGTASRDIMTSVNFSINFSGGNLVFETEAIEELESSFFETPETFTITDGQHEFAEHILSDTFNCYSFGNGVESYKIQDSFTGKAFSIDSNPNNVNKEGYRQIRRFADITYSGVYNSNTNINKLNEFNLSLANYKDDIEKNYGPIMKMMGQDTNLQVFQEDKDSVVYYGKNLLYNADGTTNLSRIEDVLGQQRTYEGEFGISYHPDSFDDYGFNSYHTDTKRGVVIKKSNNGLFEVSKQGMRNYFKKLFRDNKINHINGKYDQFHDVYILNIQYNDTEYVTWLYSDVYNGWFTRQTFNPEDMVRINGEFYSFKNGEIYRHNSEGEDGQNYNNFYGTRTPSRFIFNFSQNPSEVKRFKTMEIEGTDKWQVFVDSDQDKGYVNVSDFVKKESFFYAYLRNDNPVEDTSLLSFQGVGECVVQGNTLVFEENLDSIFSIGDQIRNSNLELVGNIVGKTATTFVLDAVNNFSNGGYVVCAKPSSIENSSILGYHMAVTMEIDKPSKTEIYAVNSEIDKSFP